MIDKTPQVFISYAWTSDEYRETIIDLASRMRNDGVDVKLDVWDLKEGQDKYAFMEQCVNNPEIDRVLILSNKSYAEKADKREGGVGTETTIISAEVYGKTDQSKFIPVVMEKDEKGDPFLPAFLKSRIYLELSDDKYEYDKLLRTIYEQPLNRKPEIGKRPDWLTKETPNSLYPLKIAIEKKTISVPDFIDMYIQVLKPFYDKNIDKDSYLANFEAMKEYRDVFLDHLKVLSMEDHFGSNMADEFELLYNAIYNIDTFEKETHSCYPDDFDIFRLHVWELFICTVAFMLHYERYADINELLVHTYFLRTSFFSSGEMKTFNYEQFRFHSKMMEDIIKPMMDGGLAKKYTLVGHYITSEREYLPIYSKKNMAIADLFLYQVYNALELDKLTNSEWKWFPSLYIYADEYESIWIKLKSRRFCNKVMPLFGVNDLEELKGCISKCTYDKEYRYEEAWSAASAILSNIKLEEIGILP